MPIDPDAGRVTALIALGGGPALSALSPQAARAQYRQARRALMPAGDPVASVRDAVLGGVPVRAYDGVGAVAGRCLLYCHGGGWVLGDLDTHDAVCRRLANQGGCRVVAVDYRLAPEHPFPAALDDTAAVFHALANEPGVDPANIAVAGDSAGANLVTVLALMTRGDLAPCFQLLFYPAVDLARERPSYAEHTSDVPLTSEAMRWFAGQYIAAHDPADWRISPLRTDLAGSAPAFVLTAGYDPLRDEGIAYAQALDAAGVQTTHLHMPTQVHGFLTMGRVVRGAATALDAAACFLRHGWRA